MALEVYFPEDIARGLTGGLVLAIQSNRGRDVEFLAGLFTGFQHQALIFGVKWPTVLADAKAELQSNDLALLDNLTQLEGGR